VVGVGATCGTAIGECTVGTTQCVAGALKCSGNPAMPEICDLQDNNCNGMVDEGDPGGGAKCGTDVGECVAGVNHCVAGHVTCQGAVGTVGGQPELCNGKDDDCNGMIDDGIGSLGSCGVSNIGECKLGMLMCNGGVPVCVGDVGPTFELCDSLDQDCDGNPTNGYNLNTDPLNCGTCNHVCSVPNAVAGCGGGGCTIAACNPGYYDLKNGVADGCEYGPCQIQGAVEACNGVDDNCNGVIDEGVVAPPICQTKGACAGAVATCTGAGGWVCNYGPNVSKDAMGNIIPETSCDGVDNDCDGIVDNAQPNKGQACDDGQAGICRGTGTMVCDAANLNGPTICNITSPGQPAGVETCDNLDNNCNGMVDEGAATGNLPGQEWVTINAGTQIMKYEASRPDASATAGGSVGPITCSRPGVQPWIDVTHPQAMAACAAIGARLCTETEWQAACAFQPAITYPVNGPLTATDHVYIEAEDAQTKVAGDDGTTVRTWQADTTSAYSGASALIALPNNGGNISAANAPTQSPRLDFPVAFQGAAATYYVWVRIYGANGNDNAVWAGINAAVPGTALNQQISGNTTYRWGVSGAFANISGTRTVSIYMRRDGVRVDAIAISKSNTIAPTEDEKIWAYQGNQKSPQPATCNAQPYDTDAVTPGNQDDILPTGALAACFANGAGANDAFDMTGNVKEWTAARAVGQNPIRGGASNNTVNGTTCGLNFTLADDTFFFPNVGFRCCR
jgi:hypothetical protein